MNLSSSFQMPRHAVVKQLWAYIKSNNLQNESNKRQVGLHNTANLNLVSHMHSTLLTFRFLFMAILLFHAFRSFVMPSLLPSLAKKPWSESQSNGTFTSRTLFTNLLRFTTIRFFVLTAARSRWPSSSVPTLLRRTPHDNPTVANRTSDVERKCGYSRFIASVRTWM